MKRTKHSLSHYRLSTFDMGQLVPVGFYEVLMGDAVRQASSILLRVSPMLAPVMHPVVVRLHHWFVPYRLLWDGWEDFITGGTDGLGDSSGAMPTIASGAGFPANGLLDKFGVPPGVANLTVNVFWIRAYQLIWNTFYRDQDLQAAATISTASGADTTTSTTLQRVCWEKDMFTAARPWTSRGPDIVLPLGSTAPVVNDGTRLVLAENAAGTTNPSGLDRAVSGAGASVLLEAAGGAAATNLYYKSGLQADLSSAGGASIIDFRRAVALQKYQEARAMYGAEYADYLRYYGIKNLDARLQRPEYLGGGKQTISFSEVLQTAEGTNPVGEMRGHGISSMRSGRFMRFFPEHGVVLSLASVRPRTMYNDGVQRAWLRRTKEDFYQKELEFIGQQEIQNQEVYAGAATKDGTFGYNDRYYDYRHIPSGVAGDFRNSKMYDWHLARILGSEPTLNGAFVECVPTKRVHAVQTDDVLWVLANHSIQARRFVGKPGTGRTL